MGSRPIPAARRRCGYASRKPVIVAVNGPSAGVGVTEALPGDVRIASDDAKFAFVFTRRGLVPEACSTWFLPRVVGIATALRWTLGGATVKVAEALGPGWCRGGPQGPDPRPCVGDRRRGKFSEGTARCRWR